MEAQERGWGSRALTVMAVLCLGLVALKFVQLLTAGPFMDETYYWMWAQHPALSYYDHPPLNAWLLALSAKLFGWTTLGLRTPVALSFVAEIGALYLIAQRLAGSEWARIFWPTLLLFLTTPMFWLVESYALPDHVLLAGLLFAIAFFLRFFRDRAEGKAGRTADLMAGALFLGLAALSKYNAAFLGAGIALYVLLFDRTLLRQGRLYLAAVLALAVQTPVLLWNLSENFASFGFILSGRHAGLAARWDGVWMLLGGILGYISPFLFVPIARFVIARRNGVPGDGFARMAFLVSSVSILVLSLFTQVLFHWNLVAYAAMLPFLIFYMRPRWLLWAQAAYGVVLAAAVLVNYSFVPLTEMVGARDEGTNWSYGWADTAAAVQAAREQSGADFVATPYYATASLLGFAMQDPDVTSLSPLREQYDFWFDASAHEGEDAILLDDITRPLSGEVSAMFDSVTEITHLDVVRGGRLLDTHRIYLAKGFKPNGP